MDKIYAFDKKTFIGSVLGEVQQGFNMSYVIDGTKDSAQVIVWNYDGQEIEPYTIIYHEKTSTFWVVSHDKVQRYKNDSGFLYIHNLELFGAIELLNARDLTDCGFNDNTYTVEQFIYRLFNLSTFEYTTVIYADDNFIYKDVDFIKTFENYTLLSALREFLDAYNMCPKLTFNMSYNSANDTYTITYAQLRITPKTGDYSLTSHNESDFDETKENKTIDKDSFGACVVSNAENVLSSKAKIYPSTGSVRLSSTEWDITPENAILRLPSKVFKGNWIKMLFPIKVTMTYTSTSMSGTIAEQLTYYSGDTYGFYRLLDAFVAQIPTQSFAEDFYNGVIENANEIIEKLNKVGAVTLFEGNKLIPFYGVNNDTQGEVKIEKGDNVPYLTKMSWANGEPRVPFVFCDRATKKMLPRELQGIAWERGSNEITGFEFLKTVVPTSGHSIYIEDTDYQSSQTTIYSLYRQYSEVPPNSETATLTVESDMDIDRYNVSFIVNYIPMTDLKVKTDNQHNRLDMQLYNQNGKLTDCVALSKMINSYSKEISSDTITKYVRYYDYNNVPKVGSIVHTTNGDYVINNISLDFSQNESGTIGTFAYCIDCEITMSKYISTKSLMVNPNTNIRDYGIPQYFNVKRKQLYRDYYELAYETYSDANQSTPYLDFTIPFAFANKTSLLSDFIAVMKLTYSQQVEGSLYWYYQLETINYFLDKMFYVVLDFNDNNIIGYGSQNKFCGFNPSRIWTGLTDTLNTPISYTDNDGKVKGINVLLCTKEEIGENYDDYRTNNGGSSWSGCLYNYSIFIPQAIYDYATTHQEYEIQINETSYYKDALEVPVFEYVCQIDDSNDVLIGDNILTQHENCIYFYSYVLANENEYFTQNNVENTNTLQAVVSPTGWRIYNGVSIQVESDIFGQTNNLRVRLYASARYDAETQTWSYGANVNATPNRDIAVFRTSKNLNTGETIDELMFIAKSVPSDNILNNVITLEINYYKLK